MSILTVLKESKKMKKISILCLMLALVLSIVLRVAQAHNSADGVLQSSNFATDDPNAIEDPNATKDPNG
jgi:hypothetical protein